MKTNFLKLCFLFITTLLPIISFCNVEYNHQKDVVYGYKDGMALILDVYSPENGQNNAGIIVVIAGGMSSNPVDAHNVGGRSDVQNLLKEGYVVFATTHSSQPKFTADEIRYDIPRAVRFIRFNASKFGINPLRIGIVGYSSGGHVSLMAGLSPPTIDINAKDPIDKVSSELQAVVAYYPSTDLLNFGTKDKTILEHFHSQGYKLDAAFDFHYWDNTSNRNERVDDTETKKEYFIKNSPITHVTEEDPPTLLIHGGNDKLVPAQQSELLISKLKEKGVVSKLLIVEDKGHGFNFRSPEGNDSKEVLNWFKNHLLE